MVIRAVAFDLDDTLTDWWTGIERAAAEVGDPDILDRVRERTWRRRDGVVVDRHHWRLQHEPEVFMAPDLTDAFLAALDPPLFDDVAPALDVLAAQVPLALLTNNPYGARVLERHGLHADVFACIAVADPEYRKPDPRAFAPLSEELGFGPHQIMYVGDSVTADVEGARASGLQPVWLDRWNDPWTLPDGVRRVGSLSELAAFVQK